MVITACDQGDSSYVVARYNFRSNLHVNKNLSELRLRNQAADLL